MSTIFTKIIDGEIPSHRIYEDDSTYAFLDINPRQPGHTLVVPKVEVDYLFDLPPDQYTALWSTANTVATALKHVTGCARVVIIVLGYEVPHAHIHLIPTNDLSDIPFPPVDVSAQERLAETAAEVRTALL
jgi:histidine triad (HIT) family protein